MHFLPERLESRCQRSLARWMGRRQTRIKSTHPVISFTFDDFPRSALYTGGHILREYGAVGTFYSSLGLMNQSGPTGEIFHEADLKALLDEGHELGCHTYHHCHSWTTPSADFERSVQENAKELRRVIPGAAMRTHSYPISCPRPRTKRKLARHFACCRGGGQTFNHDTVDANYLSAFFIEQSASNPGEIMKMIALACKANAWLIFATHDVHTAPTAYGCTPALFKEIVQFSVSSGASILPVGQAWQKVTFQSS
jgi:peptidoglycan/xylan/chitin deacetylase (PgdA/CDA1 family)